MTRVRIDMFASLDGYASTAGTGSAPRGTSCAPAWSTTCT